MMPAMSSPSRRLKPIRMKTTVPIQKSIRFFIRILPAFFALVKPVSTIANPACIQNTSAAPIRNQTPNTSPFKTLKISSVIIVPPRFPEGNAHPRLRGLLSAGAEEHFLLILWYKKTTPGISSFRSPSASFQVDVRQSGLPEIRNMFIRPHAKSSWVVG